MKSRQKGHPSELSANIRVKLLPRSAVDRIVGREGDFLKVKLTAPPVEGRANQALLEFLAKKLKVPKGSIRIISGERSRIKSIRVQGLSEDQVRGMLDGGS